MNLRSGEGCAACCCCRASMAVESPPVPPWQPKGSTMATKGRVEGKVVLITGAAHGLGKADAEALAREGARELARIRDGVACALAHGLIVNAGHRSEEHTSELKSLMRSSYAVFCFKKKN